VETPPSLEELKYPTGRWDRSRSLDAEGVAQAIATLERAPQRMRAAVAGLDDAQLDTPYRPGGWTVRQVVHHVPDSHLNAYVRCRLALTEDDPAIKTYEEGRWAELPDARAGAVEPSLALLAALHERWVLLWRSLGEADLARAYRHPEMGAVPLRQMLSLYAWHCGHHEAHITSLRARQGW
jgi:uncharacterized damage-inducible protein DinB